MSRAKRRAAVVSLSDGHLLVVRRSNRGRRYAVLPGGGVEADESARDTALRELHEETGLTGDVLRHLWTMEHTDRLADYYLVAVPVTRMVMAGPETERQWAENTYEPCWIPVADLERENLQPDTIRPLIRELAGAQHTPDH